MPEEIWGVGFTMCEKCFLAHHQNVVGIDLTVMGSSKFQVHLDVISLVP